VQSASTFKTIQQFSQQKAFFEENVKKLKKAIDFLFHPANINDAP
jgi:hypothetical protein